MILHYIKVQREDQTKRITKDRQMQTNLMSEERLEKKRYLRKVQDELHESQIEDALIRYACKVSPSHSIHEKENGTRTDSYVKLRDEKMRQYIKENSVELHELERKLKSAYLNRERAAQIRLEADIARKMKSEHEQASVEQEKQDHKRYEEVVQYQLEQQLEENEHKRQEAYEEFLKEKLMSVFTSCLSFLLDQEFKSQQTEWRPMEQEKMEAENRCILEFASYQQEREQAKEHLHQMLTEKIEMERQQRDEMERVHKELCQEEQVEAARHKQIEDMEKRIRQRLELQQTCQEQIAFKEMRRQAEKVKEAFRQMMMAEDDRIEQMNAQKHRMKQLEHKRAVEKLLEDRRQQYLADKEREAEERAMEQERETLHDLEHFDEDFRRNFQKRQADIFDEEGWRDDE
uniref:Meiosis-specific nuclear structural protein 1 n=1 Tax=Salmo trutta TaxID=8032 RepID=A0A674F032_SALTR